MSKNVIVNLTNTNYAIVKTVSAELGYTSSKSTKKSDLIWRDIGATNEFISSLLPWQFTNHFPGMLAIARKAEMIRNLEKMRAILPELFDFYPRSFVLPGQFPECKSFMQIQNSKKNDPLYIKTGGNCSLKLNNSQNKKLMIIKPDRGSLGKGIVIVDNPNVVENTSECAIAQEYIDPYLIDGYKFDLRIYALITCVDESNLRIYIHDEGMARFCTEKYDESNFDNHFSHLTNYSLNKNNIEKYDQERSKRSMSSILEIIEKENIFTQFDFGNDHNNNSNEDNISTNNDDNSNNSDNLDNRENKNNQETNKIDCINNNCDEMNKILISNTSKQKCINKLIVKEKFKASTIRKKIDEIVLHTICSIQPFLSTSYKSCLSFSSNDGKSRCFELLGFDILIDRLGSPWLLEVNHMPMLDIDTKFDEELKRSVVEGIFKIINIPPDYKKQVIANTKAQKEARFSKLSQHPNINAHSNSSINTINDVSRKNCNLNVDISNLANHKKIKTKKSLSDNNISMIIHNDTTRVDNNAIFYQEDEIKIAETQTNFRLLYPLSLSSDSTKRACNWSDRLVKDVINAAKSVPSSCQTTKLMVARQKAINKQIKNNNNFNNKPIYRQLRCFTATPKLHIPDDPFRGENFETHKDTHHSLSRNISPNLCHNSNNSLFFSFKPTFISQKEEHERLKRMNERKEKLACNSKMSEKVYFIIRTVSRLASPLKNRSDEKCTSKGPILFSKKISKRIAKPNLTVHFIGLHPMNKTV